MADNVSFLPAAARPRNIFASVATTADCVTVPTASRFLSADCVTVPSGGFLAGALPRGVKRSRGDVEGDQGREIPNVEGATKSEVVSKVSTATASLSNRGAAITVTRPVGASETTRVFTESPTELSDSFVARPRQQPRLTHPDEQLTQRADPGHLMALMLANSSVESRNVAADAHLPTAGSTSGDLKLVADSAAAALVLGARNATFGGAGAGVGAGAARVGGIMAPGGSVAAALNAARSSPGAGSFRSPSTGVFSAPPDRSPGQKVVLHPSWTRVAHLQLPGLPSILPNLLPSIPPSILPSILASKHVAEALIGWVNHGVAISPISYGGGNQAKPAAGEARGFSCALCGRTFPTVHALGGHKTMHRKNHSGGGGSGNRRSSSKNGRGNSRNGSSSTHGSSKTVASVSQSRFGSMNRTRSLPGHSTALNSPPALVGTRAPALTATPAPAPAPKQGSSALPGYRANYEGTAVGNAAGPDGSVGSLGTKVSSLPKSIPLPKAMPLPEVESVPEAEARSLTGPVTPVREDALPASWLHSQAMRSPVSELGGTRPAEKLYKGDSSPAGERGRGAPSPRTPGLESAICESSVRAQLKQAISRHLLQAQLVLQADGRRVAVAACEGAVLAGEGSKKRGTGSPMLSCREGGRTDAMQGGGLDADLNLLPDDVAEGMESEDADIAAAARALECESQEVIACMGEAIRPANTNLHEGCNSQRIGSVAGNASAAVFPPACYLPQLGAGRSSSRCAQDKWGHQDNPNGCLDLALRL